MEALSASSSFPPLHLRTMITRSLPTATMLNNKPMLLHLPLRQQHHKLPSQCKNCSNFKLSTAVSSSSVLPESPEQEIETEWQEEKFDWYAQWYPIMPLCDLDKRRPHGKKVIGIDIVVWWDRNDKEWKVFDDACPHRLAPLSEGRIDQWGRLQCVYHGWCFNGSGDCKLMPQAPRDGPPIHTSKRACVATYPSCVQNGILWFWPNTDPQYKDIFLKKKPPYVPEIDDPSFTNSMICRDIPYGYDVLIENLMDPAHVPYAHYGIMRVPKPPKREGGRPLEISIVNQDINGLTGKQMLGSSRFFAPCLYYGSYSPGGNPGSQSTSSAGSTQESSQVVAQKKFCLAFFCIPVSPGHSRLIFTSPRNVGVWVDRVVPRWIFHIGQNLILDSDLYLLHVEERKLTEVGPFNWHKSCFVPTKADALVVAFRKWLNKYGGGRVDWGTKYSGVLPPTPPREQLFDRYWSHTVNCSSCHFAYKSLNTLKVALQVISIVSIGIVAAAKQSVMSVVARNTVVSMAVVCFVASKWLSHFIYKNFHYHDYDHAFR